MLCYRQCLQMVQYKMEPRHNGLLVQIMMDIKNINMCAIQSYRQSSVVLA